MSITAVDLDFGGIMIMGSSSSGVDLGVTSMSLQAPMIRARTKAKTNGSVFIFFISIKGYSGLV